MGAIQSQPLDVDQSPCGGQCWVLARNCSLSPCGLTVALCLAAGVSLCIAMGFWWVGVPGVLPFACVEMLCLGLALVLYAGRATDRDVVELSGGELRVRCLRMGREQVTSWPSSWVQVSCEPHPQGQIELVAAGRRVLVGGEVPWAQRQRVAQSIRSALHR